MRIPIKELRHVADALLAHVEESGVDVVVAPDNYYWHFTAQERYDVTKAPANPTIGQLSDDWAELQRISRGETEAVGYALVWLASILRDVGERSPV